MRPHNFLDLSGKTFGRLKVVEPSERTNTSKLKWKVMCECGNEKLVYGTQLTRGKTRSCGCLQKEWARERCLLQKTHGLTKSLTWSSWKSMKSRCYYERNIGYKNYGGRGIKVCSRWENSFENFLKDMGERPGKEFSLDRIDNNGNYEPGNCKWSTRSFQQSNKTTTTRLHFRGKTRSIGNWAVHTGLSNSILLDRLKCGWDINRTLTEPKHEAKSRAKSRKD